MTPGALPGDIKMSVSEQRRKPVAGNQWVHLSSAWYYSIFYCCYGISTSTETEMPIDSVTKRQCYCSFMLQWATRRRSSYLWNPLVCVVTRNQLHSFVARLLSWISFEPKVFISIHPPTPKKKPGTVEQEPEVDLMVLVFFFTSCVPWRRSRNGFDLQFTIGWQHWNNTLDTCNLDTPHSTWRNLRAAVPFLL